MVQSHEHLNYFMSLNICFYILNFVCDTTEITQTGRFVWLSLNSKFCKEISQGYYYLVLP